MLVLGFHCYLFCVHDPATAVCSFSVMGARIIFFQNVGKLRVWGRKSPSGVQGVSPGGGLGRSRWEVMKIMHTQFVYTERFAVKYYCTKTFWTFPEGRGGGASAPSCPYLRAPMFSVRLQVFKPVLCLISSFRTSSLHVIPSIPHFMFQHCTAMWRELMTHITQSYFDSNP